MSIPTESSDGRASSWYSVRVWNRKGEDLHMVSSYLDKATAQEVARSLLGHYDGRMQVDIKQWRPEPIDTTLI